ncbi:MAG: response regulator [Pseudomonadales bacterium]
MAFKRALVVDDSKLARVALKKLLEEQDLEVLFADSGEAALDLLDQEAVDVIFMDHHMPGMDGLETVAAIKRNPRTATIPVMMYTTREGEVYVSQARALGAVGVIPKQVERAALFDMLLELGLVRDRRAAPGQEPPAEVREKAFDVDRRLDDQALGISVQSLVRRILEDQHLALRADILRGNRTFARQVANEILEESRRSEAEAAEPAPSRSYSQAAVSLLVLLLLVPALVLGGLYLKTARELDAARERLAGLDRTLEERMQAAETVTSDMLVDMNEERTATLVSHLAGLAWSLNESGSHPYDLPAFGDQRLAQLQTLLAHLEGIGFEGTVRLSSHLGEFCLSADRLGALSPAPADTPVEACAMIGHPLDDSSFPAERETAAFAEFVDSAGATAPGIRLEVVAHDRFASSRRYPFPESAATAGEWNAVAERNHRVEYALIPTE